MNKGPHLQPLYMGVGFEPTDRFQSAYYKYAALGHSAIPPYFGLEIYL